MLIYADMDDTGIENTIAASSAQRGRGIMPSRRPAVPRGGGE